MLFSKKIPLVLFQKTKHFCNLFLFRSVSSVVFYFYVRKGTGKWEGKPPTFLKRKDTNEWNHEDSFNRSVVIEVQVLFHG